MTPRTGRLTAIIIGATIFAGYAGAARAQVPEIIVLFDRSGSMSRPGTCGGGFNMARCGMNLLTDLSNTANPLFNFVPFGVGEANFYFWEFRSRAGDPDPVLPFPAEAALARNLSAGEDNLVFHINTVARPRLDDTADPDYDPPNNSTDFTPLAQTYCRAISELPAGDVERHIVIVSDGLQLPTGATAIDCQGPNRATGADIDFPPLDEPLNPTCRSNGPGVPATWFASHTGGALDGIQIGSWQGNMIDMALSGSLHIPAGDFPECGPVPAFLTGAFQPINANPFILNAIFLEPFLSATSTFTIRGAVGSGDDAGSGVGSPGSLAALSSPTPTGTEIIDILAAIASVTGGRLTIPDRPAGSDPFALPARPADANNDGCVNTADFDLIQQFFGQEIDYANPDTLRADITGDGIVNDRDYIGLSQHFGEGCTTPPEPLPKQNSVLFGFDNIADWSSPEAPLIQSSIRTQGTASVKVGKDENRFRTVRSVPFSTALFKGLVNGGRKGTEKIAYDIFIPPNPSHPHALGHTQLFVNCPSANLFNVFLGNVDLNGAPGAFTTASFHLPDRVRDVMLSHKPKVDFSFKIVVNAKDGDQVLDNMRFVDGDGKHHRCGSPRRRHDRKHGFVGHHHRSHVPGRR
jgi:hypothetical protein